VRTLLVVLVVAVVLAVAVRIAAGWWRRHRAEVEHREAAPDVRRHLRAVGLLDAGDVGPRDGGVVAVELAVLLPLLLLLIVGGLDLSLMMVDASAAQHAAAVVAQDGCADTTAADPMLTGDGWTVTEDGTVATVTRTRPSFGPFGGAERTVTRTAVCLAPAVTP
jgi:hypothetical protein